MTIIKLGRKPYSLGQVRWSLGPKERLKTPLLFRHVLVKLTREGRFVFETWDTEVIDVSKI